MLAYVSYKEKMVAIELLHLRVLNLKLLDNRDIMAPDGWVGYCPFAVRRGSLKLRKVRPPFCSFPLEPAGNIFFQTCQTGLISDCNIVYLTAVVSSSRFLVL